ncbi:sugar phosphate isomerase/epimerase [Ochrobactrum daejeonense]|uniref:Sugar phosphate isomerase/epimerase n=1 Tax=Brucella daejeonensis TaxID=659015 RepID=A0A7W9ENK2_9HYPH|nr:sugar phosphate isomerase/epimerase family protein [Brucella daejeonensis]MBB5703230.1 sugar phosphate isomerase/epimerase [Brucella daejeonensis]NKB80095.1 sugar phosphate isomerase/epimerase [Brucella daejeonensis]
MSELPLLGAAMPLAHLESNLDFILSENRDLEIQDFIEVALLKGDWKPRADRVKAALDGYKGRLGIHGPFWGLNFSNQDEDIRKIVTTRYLQGLDVCEYIGATQMVIHSPYTLWSCNNVENFPEAVQQTLDNAHDTLAPVVKRAEEIGCTLVVENIEDVDTDARCALADSFQSSAVAVSVDTGHAHYSYGSQGAHPVDYFISRAGNRLHHVHLQDADGHADRHWGIGEGTIRWHGVFAALAKLDSNPRLILELRNKDKIMPSVKYLQDAGLAR